jgi:uncharacterized membrane protein YphA (DoxX/SURF4 family)
MTALPIPLQALYAGLAGTVLALIVATAMNRWSLRVFCLLALRLAIGWHFLFEGLYKVNSHLVGPTETNRPFSSEPYFRNAPGPVGGFMRKQFGDAGAVIADRVKPPREMKPGAFEQLPLAEQAAACPPSVAAELDQLESKAIEAVKAEAAKDLAAADAQEATALKDAKSDADREKARATAETARTAARKKNENAEQVARERILDAKAAYAKWVYGELARPAKLKFVKGRDNEAGDVMVSAPERLEFLESLRRDIEIAEDRRAAGLGNGAGIEQKRAAELRADLIAAESDLARDADLFVAKLKEQLNGGKAPEEDAKPRSRGQIMDRVTMWFLVAVGACLMAGLFTRFMCILGAGFLVMTYLAYPPPPFYPLPPNSVSEGNPVYINKNAIECLALIVLATFPTGRWMGLDALIARFRGRKYSDAT